VDRTELTVGLWCVTLAYLSGCLPVCLPVCLFVGLSACSSAFLFVCLFVCLAFYSPVCLSAGKAVSVSAGMSS
jgi:hypothetical protein